MSERSYGQFCPVAMAAELLGARWTVLVLRELLAGSTRFNELRRGLPRMSPALLALRLRELEAAGVVERRAARDDAHVQEYALTRAGRDLGPLVEAFGCWGQRWVSAELSLEQLDVQLLMWDMRRNLQLDPLPAGRHVIQFQYPALPARDRRWWLLVDRSGGVDLCSTDPGFEVDLYVSTDLKTMTAIWLGLDTVRAALARDAMYLTGDPALAAGMQAWLGLSPFAREAKLAAA